MKNEKKPKLKKGEIYKFEWNDTYSFDGWFNEKDIEELTVPGLFQNTVGFYIKTYLDWHLIGAHMNDHDGFKPYGNICWIPKKCVKKITLL